MDGRYQERLRETGFEYDKNIGCSVKGTEVGIAPKRYHNV